MGTWSTPAAYSEQSADYVMIFEHDNGERLALTSKDIVATNDPDLSRAAFAAAVDLLVASPDFTYVQGTRSFPGNQTYTP
jgi:hypothetical protein